MTWILCCASLLLLGLRLVNLPRTARADRGASYPAGPEAARGGLAPAAQAGVAVLALALALDAPGAAAAPAPATPSLVYEAAHVSAIWTPPQAAFEGWMV